MKSEAKYAVKTHPTVAAERFAPHQRAPEIQTDAPDRLDAWLDQALMDTFPASDPIAIRSRADYVSGFARPQRSPAT